MRVRCWGVRGSLATPLDNAGLRRKFDQVLRELRPEDLASRQAIAAALDRSPSVRTYGGNTSCLEVAFNDSTFILDGGSGLRGLSTALMADGRGRTQPLSLFFTHFHWDHICGLPFFTPLYLPNRNLNIYSGRDDAEHLLRNQMKDANFPAKWETLPCQIAFHQLQSDQIHQVDGAEVRLLPLVHPDTAYGYRISRAGRTICYLTDTEVTKNPTRFAASYASFVAGADLVIVDAMYGFLEYHDHYNWGHSSIFTWIDFFAETPIGELVIFHHDPGAEDADVDRLLDSAVRYRSLVAPNVTWKLSAAFEGQTWDL